MIMQHTNCGAPGHTAPQGTGDPRYESYKQYHPDKWEAISALRRDTGLGFSEANRIINDLFGMTDDDECRKADAEHEIWYQQQEAQRTAAEKKTKKAGAAAGIGLFAAIKAIFSTGKNK
jgi:hypothetical protein